MKISHSIFQGICQNFHMEAGKYCVPVPVGVHYVCPFSKHTLILFTLQR